MLHVRPLDDIKMLNEIQLYILPSQTYCDTLHGEGSYQKSEGISIKEGFRNSKNVMLWLFLCYYLLTCCTTSPTPTHPPGKLTCPALHAAPSVWPCYG